MQANISNGCISNHSWANQSCHVVRCDFERLTLMRGSSQRAQDDVSVNYEEYQAKSSNAEPHSLILPLLRKGLLPLNVSFATLCSLQD